MSTLGRQIIIDLFTDAYRVSGRAQVGTGGLMAELSNPNSDYLDLENAYISRIHEPAKIVASYAAASFCKQNINFIVLQDRREGTVLGTPRGRTIFSRGRPVQVFLTIPSFEIEGEVMHDGQPTPSTILVHAEGPFQPILAATASAASHPDISYTGDLILVQKAMIGIFCLARHEN